MPFPTVKSDPWRKKKRGRRSFQLWSGKFWKQLVDRAFEDRNFKGDKSPISEDVIRMIGDMNELLYGSR